MPLSLSYRLVLFVVCMSYLSTALHAQLRSKSAEGFVQQESSLDSADMREEKCWKGNCNDGAGQYYFSKQNALYSGEFKEGLPSGNGEAIYANGESFRGGWKKGYFDGYGQLKLSDGTLIEGIWNRGMLVKQEYASENHDDQRGEVYAIVIGISNYPNMPALKYADDDAYQLYAHLRSPEGGAIPKDQINLLVDDMATEENIEKAFEKICSQTNEKDMVFVYFSGHGEDDALLPYDYDGVLKKVYYQEIESLIRSSEAKCKFLAFDACHAGNAFRSKGMANSYSSFVDWSDGTIYLLSSKEQETSLESDGLRQGVFSHFLLKGLSGRADINADQYITIQELYSYINKAVVEYTNGRQHPRMKGSYNPSDRIAVMQK